MNRKQRKEAKMFKRKYGRATNPWWQKQVVTPQDSTERAEQFEQAMNTLWQTCRAQCDSGR